MNPQIKTKKYKYLINNYVFSLKASLQNFPNKLYFPPYWSKANYLISKKALKYLFPLEVSCIVIKKVLRSWILFLNQKLFSTKPLHLKKLVELTGFRQVMILTRLSTRTSEWLYYNKLPDHNYIIHNIEITWNWPLIPVALFAT